MAIKSIHDLDKADKRCPICKGEGWVCENHTSVPWNFGDPECCHEGAGEPCTCNPLRYTNQNGTVNPEEMN